MKSIKMILIVLVFVFAFSAPSFLLQKNYYCLHIRCRRNGLRSRGGNSNGYKQTSTRSSDGRRSNGWDNRFGEIYRRKFEKNQEALGLSDSQDSILLTKERSRLPKGMK